MTATKQRFSEHVSKVQSKELPRKLSQARVRLYCVVGCLLQEQFLQLAFDPFVFVRGILNHFYWLEPLRPQCLARDRVERSNLRTVWIGAFAVVLEEAIEFLLGSRIVGWTQRYNHYDLTFELLDFKVAVVGEDSLRSTNLVPCVDSSVGGYLYVNFPKFAHVQLLCFEQFSSNFIAFRVPQNDKSRVDVMLDAQLDSFSDCSRHWTLTMHLTRLVLVPVVSEIAVLWQLECLPTPLVEVACACII